MKRTVAITIDEKLHEEAKAQCKRYGLSLSHVVSELLEGFIEIGEGENGKAADVRGVQAPGSEV